MLKYMVGALSAHLLILSLLLFKCSAILIFDSTDNSQDQLESADIASSDGSSSKNLFDATPIRGVNIGGVFLIEPFIRPSLFDQFLLTHNATEAPIDEWTFSATLGKEEAKKQLEQHWDTFVTKDHLEAMAQYGINWIRIPIGYWAFNLTQDEPFVDGQVQYVERLLGWAREIGLKVELDMHGAPGSQNGFDNSGRRGTPRWLLDRKNVDRTLDALEKMTRLAVEWDDVVYGIQILNEPSRWKWPVEEILRFYNEAYAMVRGITKDMYFMVHDTFLGPNEWPTLVSSNWTNALMDTHLYQMFDNYMVSINESMHINMVSEMTKDITVFDRTNIGVVVGEFSAATHDCTKYINGFGKGSRWEGTLEGTDHPSCPFETCACTGDYGSDYTQFSEHYRRFLKRYIDAQLVVYDRAIAGWFYWNFRTESAPEWDYLLGVEQGWIPRFPRAAVPLADESSSNSLEVANTEFGDLQSSATPGSGAGVVPIHTTIALVLFSLLAISIV